MTRKTGKNSDPDAEGFESLVGPVRPVKARRRVALRSALPKPKATFSRADDRAVLDESLDLRPGEAGYETGEELSFRRPHVSQRVFRNLRRGHYAVQDELDLHGMTASMARSALRTFMTEALAHDYRCVRIVHGKGLRSGPGGPVLKALLNGWLPRWNEVLAFVTAPARDGGSGALYVLLAD